MDDKKPELRHLVRIANTDIQGNKPLLPALRRIKGVGVMYANAACGIAGIDKKRRIGSLNESEIKALEDVILNPKKFHMPIWMLNRKKDPETGEDKHLLTSDLMFTKDLDIKMMKKTKSYKGMRHQWGLPVRGQRTKSNFRKNKGKGLGVKKKKPQGSGK